MNKISLMPSCILAVPLQTYDNDFTFIVNGEEFKTNRLISDLLSPVICQEHINDPIFHTFTINTSEKGDFSRILDLVNFKQISITESELPFISEVIEILGIEQIEKEIDTAITIENVFTNIKEHEKFQTFYSNRFSDEIDFISSNFSSFCESHEEELSSLSIDTLYSIFSNDKLEISTEDQLIKFINKLYSKSSEFSILYETVLFEYVSSEMIRQFISLYDINDLTGDVWNRLSTRLEQKAKPISKKVTQKYNRHKNSKIGKKFKKNDKNDFRGIINYLCSQSKNEIEKEIDITSSSVYKNEKRYHPRVVTFYEDQINFFSSSNEPNSWICFDFKEHRVVPTDYAIRSKPADENCSHPKSWVIEGSNDNDSWEVIDEENDCPHLNGYNVVHTFQIDNQNSNEFRYIRMRLTGPNWRDKNFFEIDSFEIYGKLI